MLHSAAIAVLKADNKITMASKISRMPHAFTVKRQHSAMLSLVDKTSTTNSTLSTKTLAPHYVDSDCMM
jgi:hypothetical protein